MPSPKPLRASLTIDDDSGLEGLKTIHTIKRLALLFDEIYITPPALCTVKESFIQQRELEKEQLKTNPKAKLTKINHFRDTEESISLHLDAFRDPELRDTLHAFEEAGIVKTAPISAPKLPPDIAMARNRITAEDAGDAEFRRISRTPEGPYDLGKTIQIATFDSVDRPGETVTLHIFKDPPAIGDSRAISINLINADQLGSIPIFHKESHRAEMQYKHAKYKEGLDILRRHHPEALADIDFSTKLGEVAFSVTNGVFDSKALSLCSPEDVLRYRESMEVARHKYFAEDIVTIASMLKDSPWSESSRIEVLKYVNGKLKSDIIKYEEQSKLTFRKLAGQIAVHSTSVFAGGGIGTLVGTILPNTTPWGLLIIGALAGAAKEGAPALKSMLDLWNQRKAESGSAISFVADFEKKTAVRRRKKLLGLPE